MCYVSIRLTLNDAMVVAFEFELAPVKRVCHAESCDFNSRIFLSRSSLLGGKLLSYFLWSLLKCLSRFSFCASAGDTWHITHIHFALSMLNAKKKSNLPPIQYENVKFYFFWQSIQLQFYSLWLGWCLIYVSAENTFFITFSARIWEFLNLKNVTSVL